MRRPLHSTAAAAPAVASGTPAGALGASRSGRAGPSSALNLKPSTVLPSHLFNDTDVAGTGAAGFGSVPRARHRAAAVPNGSVHDEQRHFLSTASRPPGVGGGGPYPAASREPRIGGGRGVIEDGSNFTTQPPGNNHANNGDERAGREVSSSGASANAAVVPRGGKSGGGGGGWTGISSVSRLPPPPPLPLEDWDDGATSPLRRLSTTYSTRASAPVLFDLTQNHQRQAQPLETGSGWPLEALTAATATHKAVDASGEGGRGLPPFVLATPGAGTAWKAAAGAGPLGHRTADGRAPVPAREGAVLMPYGIDIDDLTDRPHPQPHQVTLELGILRVLTSVRGRECLIYVVVICVTLALCVLCTGT